MAARRVRGPFRRRPGKVDRGRALGKGVTSRDGYVTLQVGVWGCGSGLVTLVMEK